MSYTANQYNYATPLSGSTGLFSDASNVSDIKYFTLSDNVLDGSYYPITGDVGLWGSSVSDASGNLSTPFVVTVTENLTVNAFRLTGSQYNYPVAFTVKFYNGSTLLYTITETANANASYVHYMTKTLSVTSYVISITKISAPGSAARLYNTYNPAYVKRVDTLKAKQLNASELSFNIELFRSDAVKVKQSQSRALSVTVHGADAMRTKSAESRIVAPVIKVSDSMRVKQTHADAIHNTLHGVVDTLRVSQPAKSAMWNYIAVTRDRFPVKVQEDRSRVRNTIDVTKDTLRITGADAAELINIHSVMKSPSRKVYGKVYITYTDPMLSSETDVVGSSVAYNSRLDQVLDSVRDAEAKYFVLYDNDLSGSFVAGDEFSQVGWVSADVSNADGTFNNDPKLTISFSARPVVGLPIVFDDSHGSIAEDFTVRFVKQDGSYEDFVVTGNTSKEVTVTQETLSDVVSIEVTVHKVTKPGFPAAVLEVPIMSTILYVGYQDRSDLISVDMLEELTYDDDIEALGGVSANEVTVMLDNSSKDFYFNSGSAVSKQLRRNRKIVPWLGAEIAPGTIEWYTLGTYWSYKWEVPVNSLTAKVVAFDTIGLLGTTSFTNHQVLVGKSVGDAIAYVLDEAKTTLDFIEYDIDPALYDITIPYMWFAAGSHAAALRKISGCYPMHIYCDRQGVIQAKPQKLRLDYYYDVWADNTNVIDKTYDSLYTTLPNVINVKVVSPTLSAGEQLAQDKLVFDVSVTKARTLNFSKPYVSNLSVDIDCDSTAQYSYKVYSWGIEFTFSGTGQVRSITCTGTAVDTSETTTLTHKDSSSILLNGAVTRDISSDFIQDANLASTLINRLASLSELDKYDAKVNYRGDIALSINDPILLLDGIAPDNRYNIKRHQLSWNGSLTGSADLNT